MSEPQAFIDRLKVIDLPELQLGRSEIIVFVGPNNGGKSYCLDTIYTNVSGGGAQGDIDLNIGIQGTAEDLWQRLARTPGATVNAGTMNGPGWTVAKETLDQVWKGTSLVINPHRFNLRFLQQLFVRIPLDSRAQISGTKILESTGDQPATNDQNNPVSMMARHPTLLTRVSTAFQDAFGIGIFLNTGTGAPNYPILLGVRPDLGGEDPVTDASQQKFSLFSNLEQQGSGMKAFAKIVLATLSRDAFLTFIDEPETFLHPPQAYVLGRFIAENRSSNQQLFLATHSPEFLKGLLEGASERVRIIRVTRKDSKSHAATIEPKDLQELWSDLFLQYSNVLAGLFHDIVVGCEAEQDCRYFSGIYSALARNRLLSTRHDIQFIPCAGKGGLKKILIPLRAFGVNSVVIVDFDVIENAGELRKLAEAAACPWTTIEKDAAIVRDYFNKLENRVTTKAALAAIDEFQKRVKKGARVCRHQSDQGTTAGNSRQKRMVYCQGERD